jgi:hypothetical protein
MTTRELDAIEEWYKQLLFRSKLETDIAVSTAIALIARIRELEAVAEDILSYYGGDKHSIPISQLRKVLNK